MFEYAGQTARPVTAVRGGEGAVSGAPVKPARCSE